MVMLNKNTLIFEKLAGVIACALPFLLLFSRSLADFSVLTIGLLFLAKSYFTQDWQWLARRWIHFSILFWLYLLLVSTPLSQDVLDSFLHSIFFIRWPLFASAIAYWVLVRQRHQRYLLTSLALVVVFIVMDTWLQYYLGQDLLGHMKHSVDRLTGPFTKPIPGIMLLRVLFILLFANLVFVSLKKPMMQLFSTVLVLLVGLLTIFITGERMAFLLCVTGSTLVMLGLWLQHKNLRRKIVASFGFVLLLIVLVSLNMPEVAQRTIHSLIEKVQHFSNSDYGVVFNAAWAAWQQNFMIGSGFHTYKLACDSLGVLAQSGMNCTHAHNLYLQIGAETGLIGFVLFVALIVSIYDAAIVPILRIRAWYWVSLVFVILSVSFWPLIGGISILNNWVAALVWLGVGYALTVAERASSNNPL
jgi:O-antigen ligase